MAWQLAALAARAAGLVRVRRRWQGAAGVAGALGIAEGRGSTVLERTVLERVATRTVASWPMADRKAYDAALGSVDAAGAAVLARAVAAGAPLSALIALGRVWPTLAAPVRDAVAHPLGDASPHDLTWLGTPATQVDPTTCGAASMSVMLIVADPYIALWVLTGQVLAGYLPPEVRRIPGAAPWAASGPAPASIKARWDALQLSVFGATRRGAIVGFPWPRAFGTPPWRVNNSLRFGGISFRGLVLDDADQGDVQAAVTHASAALNDGIPVPVYVSGDSTQGVATVMPRHVVLFTHRTAEGFLVYEPGGGKLHFLDDAGLAAGTGKKAAFGHWNRVAWLVLPTPRKARAVQTPRAPRRPHTPRGPHAPRSPRASLET